MINWMRFLIGFSAAIATKPSELHRVKLKSQTNGGKTSGGSFSLTQIFHLMFSSNKGATIDSF